jgi:ABC-2 type transport system permease protein
LERDLGWRHIRRVVVGLVSRDLHVLRKSIPAFVIRVVLQPMLFLVIFAYVFPKIGQGVGGEDGSETFSTLLVTGTVALACFFNGVQSVALPLIGDLGVTREIEDRVSAPVPIQVVTGSKILSATLEGVVAGLLVLPFALVIPSTNLLLDLNLPLFVVSVIIAAVCGATFGLLLGTAGLPKDIPTTFSLILVPMTFFSASYYAWQSLDAVPVVKWLVAFNPVLYINENLRSALSPEIPHMPVVVSLSVSTALSVLFFVVGTRRFARRVRG